VNTHLDYLNAFFSEPLPYSSRPLGWRFEIRFECSPEALPLGLTKRMIYVEGQAPILEIFQEKPGFFRLATTVPMHSYTLDRGEQRRLAARMLRVCETIIPDLEYNLKKVIPDLRDPDRSETVDLPALYPFQELKRIPSHILSFGSGAQSLPPNPMPGLWITHEEVNPKEAIWGAFEASRSALKAIEASFVNKTESAKL